MDAVISAKPTGASWSTLQRKELTVRFCWGPWDQNITGPSTTARKAKLLVQAGISGHNKTSGLIVTTRVVVMQLISPL